MAATVWTTMTRMEPKEWLLGNGEIIREPGLEMSGSGKKVRIAGTTTSVYASELDDLLGRAARAVAELKQTHVMFETTELKDRLETALQFNPAGTKARLHLVHDPTNTHGMTTLWWRFKDPNSIFEAYLSIKMSNQRYHNQAAPPQHMVVTLTIPGRHYYNPTADLVVANVTDGALTELTNSLSHLDRDLHYKWQEFVRDNRPNWPVDHLGSEIQQNPRAGVKKLLEIVRDIEDLDAIQVPDLGDPYKPSYRSLEVYETNCNAALISDLTEYLDAAPTIEQAVDLYDQLLATLRSVGIAVSGKSANDFMAALLAGEKATLNMQVSYLAETNNKVDNEHTLSVHLPSGTFIVECTHQDADPNMVAEKWDESLTMASLTGQEDTLLAYARAYVKEHSKERTKQILKERE